MLILSCHLSQLQKAIEGSTSSGVRLRPPLASFRDASRKAKKSTHSPSAPSSPTRNKDVWSEGENREAIEDPGSKLAETEEPECKVTVGTNSKDTENPIECQPPSHSSSIPLSSLCPQPEKETSGERESDEEPI